MNILSVECSGGGRTPWALSFATGPAIVQSSVLLSQCPHLPLTRVTHCTFLSYSVLQFNFDKQILQLPKKITYHIPKYLLNILSYCVLSVYWTKVTKKYTHIAYIHIAKLCASSQVIFQTKIICHNHNVLRKCTKFKLR